MIELREYIKKYGRKSNKCEICKKHYKLPTMIFAPRDKICMKCELMWAWKNDPRYEREK